MTDSTPSIAAQSLANGRRWFPDVYSRGQTAALAHCALGLTGEVGEVAQLVDQADSPNARRSDEWRQAFGEELSDVYAYCLNLAALLAVDLPTGHTRPAGVDAETTVRRLTISAGAVANLVKTLDTGKKDPLEIRGDLRAAVLDTTSCLRWFAYCHSIDLDEEWARKQAICEERWGSAPEPEAPTVHLALTLSEGEQLSAWACNPDDYDEDNTIFEADVPAPLWAELNATWSTANALLERIFTAAGIDIVDGRPAEPCPGWVGDAGRPARAYWTLMMPASGNDQEWPAGGFDVNVSAYFDTVSEAEAFLGQLPDEFFITPTPTGIASLQRIERSHLVIKEHRLGGSGPAECYRCGRTPARHGQA